jgi:hypothetical protein
MLVSVLATAPCSAVPFDPKVRIVDRELYLRWVNDCDCYCGSMNATFTFCRRDTLYPVSAGLIVEMT